MTQTARRPDVRLMSAYRLPGWGQPVELVDVPVPVPRGTEVLVGVQAVGLCHSDLFVMSCDGGVLPYDLPMTLGHEVAGRVVAVGETADPSLIGRDGVVHGVWSCGECHNCRRGRDNHCVALDGRVGCGLGRDGGLAEYVLLPDGRHFVTATGVPPTTLAPLADAGLTAYHAIRQHRDALVGDCAALVIGVGGLGHLAVQILRATTSARVVAVDPRPEACALAERLGAHHTAMSVDDALVRLTSSTGLTGADVVLDFVGSAETMRLGAEVLAPGSRLVVVGGARGSMVVGKGLSLPLGWQVSAPFWGSRADLVAVVELAERGLLDPVVEVVPFGDVPAAYARLHDGGVTGRIVVVPEKALAGDDSWKRYDVTAMDHRMTDKVVLLTGATGGLGRTTAERLAEEGARLVLTDLDDQACKELATDLVDHPAGHLAARLDVADERQWIDVAATVERECGRLDGLVNNAGIGSTATVEDETLDRWESVMSVDSTGVWLGMKHLGPLIAAAGGGSIVNLSSILGTVGGFGNSAAYHAAKGAVRSMTKNAALHWATAGVRVNSVHPGFIGTAELLERFEGTARHEAMLANTPVGRLGRGEEIAAVVAFLISDDSTFVTGSEIYADGGYTAR